MSRLFPGRRPRRRARSNDRGPEHSQGSAEIDECEQMDNIGRYAGVGGDSQRQIDRRGKAPTGAANVHIVRGLGAIGNG